MPRHAPTILRAAAVSVFLWIFCIGCSSAGDLRAAEAEVANFHQNLDQTKYAVIVSGTDIEYRKSAQQDDLTAPFRAVHETMGRMIKSDLKSTDVHGMIGATRIKLHYETVFMKGLAVEEFTFMIRDHQVWLLKYETHPWDPQQER